MAQREEKSEDLKNMEKMVKDTQAMEDMPVNISSGTAIDSNIQGQLDLLQKYMGLDNTNEALSYLLGIADVLINYEEIANLVLMAAKHTDGVLTEEELNNFIGGKADNSREENSSNHDNLVTEILEKFIPGSKDKLFDFVQNMQTNKPDALNNIGSFIDELQGFMQPQEEIKDTLDVAKNEVATDLEDNADKSNQASKIRVFAWNKNTPNKSEAEIPYGNKWVDAAVKKIK